MRAKSLVKSIVSVVLLMVFSACHDSESTEVAAFENTRWELIAYGEKQNLQKRLDAGFVTAYFNKVSGDINGSGGCNNYSGKYTVLENRVTIEQLVQTEMACQTPIGAMQQAADYISLLTQAKTYLFNENFLQVTCVDDKVLQFEKPIEVDVNQENNGTKIYLEERNFLVVSLPTNPSTGFSWKVEDINTSIMVEVGEPKYVSSELNNSFVVGAGGTVSYRFRAIQSGTTSFEMVYKQPWSQNIAENYRLEIVVDHTRSL